MSYLVRPIEFEDEPPEICAICDKCSDLSGIKICKDKRGIFFGELPDEFIVISKEKRMNYTIWIL